MNELSKEVGEQRRVSYIFTREMYLQLPSLFNVYPSYFGMVKPKSNISLGKYS
jgi:hypothetical protein